ncbi:VanZ family protein [Amycolatopsis sp. NBC_01480]|uniref:VanZ family protein n=1 Tax=Amycolatopsis sp. NBC_01480 TaxID=2903562 RepID=UPI002E28A887|nr:VanZ family protein [Amycolatopsis sp. NBC_01480]
MITDFLLDNSALVPVVLLLIAVVCLSAGYLILRTRQHGHRILRVLVVLSVLPVVALTLVPASSPADYVACVVQFSVPTVTRVELLANVALFFPPVFFATLATRRPLLMLVAGAGISAAIEAVQALVPAIGRACDTNDWAMNTIGTILAVLLASATIALTNRAVVRKAADGHAEIRPGDRLGL